MYLSLYIYICGATIYIEREIDRQREREREQHDPDAARLKGLGFTAWDFN